ncbi:MAG: dipeptidase [Trueperaceae bacterium]
MSNDADRLSHVLDGRHERHLSDLFDLLRIPSVSTDPARSGDVRAAADFLRTELATAGFDARLLETGGHPAVHAHRAGPPGAPSVLIYGHYDVQPADPLELWDSDPFEPVVRDGMIVARGASDDKGQAYAHVKGALALLEADGELPVSLTFLIEGEEEIGSPNLAPLIERERELLAADVVLVSDGAMLPNKVPTITYGLKGMTYLEVRVRTSDHDLHSGAFGGGVPNAAMALATMLAGLKDEGGRIAVPGFYDEVLEIDDEERAQLARVPFDPDAWAASAGVTATPGEPGRSLLERLWTRPTLDVNGLGGGFQGEGSKTVIPAEAFAKVSCRLVPDQEPARIAERVERHLRDLAPAGTDVEVRHLNSGAWALSPLTGGGVRSAAEAIRAVDGRDPVFVRTGGSIPVVADLQRLLGAEVVLLDMGQESDRIHSPNERFDVDLYHRGIRLSAELLRALGRR